MAFLVLHDKDRVILRWRLRRIVSARSRPPPCGDTRRRLAAGASLPFVTAGRQRPTVPKGSEGEEETQHDGRKQEDATDYADPQRGGRTSGHPPYAVDRSRVSPRRFFGR